MYRLTASTTATWGRTAVALPRAGDGGASSPAAPAWQSLSGARLALVTSHWSLHHIIHTPTSLVTTAKLQPTPATSGGAASIILRVGKYGLGWERLLARWPSSRRRDLGVALHPGNFFASKSRIFAFQVKKCAARRIIGGQRYRFDPSHVTLGVS